MKEKHVIIRAYPVAGEAVADSPLDRLPLVPSQLELEEADLDRRQERLLLAEDNVLAVVPDLIMKAGGPKAETADLADNPALSWGVRAVKADTSSFDGTGIKVAVLDSGISEHDAFSGLSAPLQKNFTSAVPHDDEGHGTHCAGTIVGRNVAGMRIGIARGVTDLLIGKVMHNDNASTVAILKGMHWAAQEGANVISLSVAFDFPGYVRTLETRGDHSLVAISKALESYHRYVSAFEKMAAHLSVQGHIRQPVLIVAAAGNFSRAGTPFRYKLGVCPPAVARGIYSVAALWRQPEGLAFAPFSNRGANFAAPGMEIPSAWLQNSCVEKYGTSTATAHVAGVAALWADKLRRAGKFTTFEWKRSLEASASTQLFAPGFDDQDVDFGLPSAPQ